MTDRERKRWYQEQATGIVNNPETSIILKIIDQQALKGVSMPINRFSVFDSVFIRQSQPPTHGQGYFREDKDEADNKYHPKTNYYEWFHCVYAYFRNTD